MSFVTPYRISELNLTSSTIDRQSSQFGGILNAKTGLNQI